MRNRYTEPFRGLVKVLWLAGLVSSGSVVQAEAESELEVNIPTYRIGVENRSYWPRYGMTAEGVFSGYAQELLDAFASDSGYRFEYIPLSERQLAHQLRSGAIDLRYPDSPSWRTHSQLQGQLSFSRPVDFSLVGLNVMPEHLGQRRLGSLGMLVGFKSDQFKKQVDAGELLLYPTATLDHLAIIAGEGLVDGVYADPYVVQYHLRQQGYKTDVLSFDYSHPHTLHNYSLSTLYHPELLKQFDRWFLNQRVLVLWLRKKHGIYDF